MRLQEHLSAAKEWVRPTFVNMHPQKLEWLPRGQMYNSGLGICRKLEALARANDQLSPRATPAIAVCALKGSKNARVGEVGQADPGGRAHRPD